MNTISSTELNSNRRDSNLELLRIISMIMIVISHWTTHNGTSISNVSNFFNILLFSNTRLGNIGVIMFVITMGYFSCQKNHLNIKRLINLIIETWFYSFVFYLILIRFGLVDFSIKRMIFHFFPIIFKEYWFITAYVVLFILSPFINKFISGISKNEHKRLIFIFTLLFVLIATFTKQEMYGNKLILLIYYYLIGAYIKIYDSEFLNKNKYKLLIISWLLLFFSTLFLFFINVKFNLNLDKYTHFYNENSLFSVIFGTCIFYIFSKKQFFYNKIINYLSTCVLAVYLITENNSFRSILWIDIFKVSNYMNSPLLIVNLLYSVIVIFIVCFCVEIVRKCLFEKITNYLIDKFLNLNLIKKGVEIFNYDKKND